MKQKGSKEKVFQVAKGYVFLIPWMIGFCCLTFWPILRSFYLSFTDYDVFTPPKWVGLNNYIEMFTQDRMFWGSVKVTVEYVLLSVPIKLIAALLIAMVLNQRIKGIGIYRTVYYLPSILGASVAMSVTWKMVLSPTGFVN